LKRIAGLLSLVILAATALIPAAAQQFPALEALRASAPGISFSVQIPAPRAYDARVPAPALSGEQLFQYLHQSVTPAPGFQPSYSASKSYMYATADNTGCNGGPGIITLYSQVCISGASGDGNSYKEQGDQNGDGKSGDFINAEHIWPQSYFNSNLPMVADLHQLGSTLSVPNGRRGNLNYALVSNPTYSTSAGSKLGKEGFEPADAAKGNVARAVLYFVVRYYDRSIRQGMDYNSFWTKNVPMFLQWNRMDPPDAAEKRRNDLIEKFQGNRNPFVDDPSLADRIGETVLEAH
jgi:hypothetical protein